MKGFINVIKPQGMTSAAVVSIVKKKLNLPCGHMGTLDPMATGILPVGVDKTSRLFQYLLDKEKTYLATFEFGYLTDTLDKTGKVIATTKNLPSRVQIERVLPFFTGEIEQVPPNYSAKCIDGKRGYQLARKGIEFSLPAKKVNVISFEVIKQISNTEFCFKIVCKGGTYIRSLARDIGTKLNSLCTMTALDRCACGVFNYSNGITVEDLKLLDDLNKYLIPPENALSFSEIRLTNKKATRILNGIFDTTDYKDGYYKVFNESDFWGVGKVSDKILKIVSYVR